MGLSHCTTALFQTAYGGAVEPDVELPINISLGGHMQDSETTREWQVTCVCGWRTLGTKEEVVSAVIKHGRDTHSQDVTEEQAMAQAVPITKG